MMSKMNTKVRLVRCPRCWQVLPELAEVPVYKCGGCGAVLQAKKPKNGTVDARSGGVEENFSGDQKTEQVSGDQDSGRVSDHQSPVNSINEPDRNSDHNEARSSTELSCHEDPESSPEAIAHNRTDQDQEHEHDEDEDEDHDQEHEHNQDQDHDREHEHDQDEDEDHDPEHEHNQDEDEDEDEDHGQDRFMSDGVSENRKNEAEFEEISGESTASPEIFSSSELNTMIVKDSNGGSKSNFKSLIAEKLLNTRQRKVPNPDEDDILSEDSTADLNHRKRFNRISSVETSENSQFGNTSYYYDGSVSSYDGTHDHVAGKNRVEWRHRRGKDLVMGSEKVNHRSTGRSFYGNPTHRPPVVPENAKLEKLELLKMVLELQDQLERTNVPTYYNHISNPPGGFGRRMAFSGKAGIVNRARETCPCHYCCPPDRHFSAQLPRQLVSCNGPHYVPAPYYVPSSPQHHSGSEFSVLARPEPKPDNHRHRKPRHLRPVSGGAPLIACYRCSELLELPQNFLVFKKRYHSLRCGACLKVLNFTVSNGSRVSRYYPEETIAAPPCSEVDDYGELTGSRAGPVSCSDRSFQKSYSTETDKRGSSELVDERKRVIGSGNGSGLVDEPYILRNSGRKKVTSEIEEVTGGSPLHRLMGYASPSKVIRG